MRILSFLAGLILSLFPAVPTQNFSATVPTTPALIDTYLSAGIAATDNSLTLANGLTRAGTALSGTICLTLDANTPNVEYVCGTASSTSVTGLSRGIDPLNPNSTSSALAYSHRRFASAQITDYPTIAYLTRNANGVDPYTNPLYYSSGAPSFITSSTQAASKGYVDAQISAGGAPASFTVGGLLMVATTASTTQGTATGVYNSQTYTLVPQNSLFNATSSATNIIPVTSSNGKLSQGFLDLTQAFTWSATSTFSGQAIFNGSSTFSSSTFTILPMIGTSTPNLAGQAASKNYVDSKVPVFISSSTLSATFTTGPTYIATSTFTLANAGHVRVSAYGGIQNGTIGDGCKIYVYVDSATSSQVLQFINGTVSGFSAGQYPLGFDYITPTLSAASHTVNLVGQNIAGGSCSFVADNNSVNFEYAGQ